MKQTIDNRFEEADTVLMEAQAIVSFLDEATDCLFNAPIRFIDDIHKETAYGLHLCFEAALNRMEQALSLLNEKAPEDAS